MGVVYLATSFFSGKKCISGEKEGAPGRFWSHFWSILADFVPEPQCLFFFENAPPQPIPPTSWGGTLPRGATIPKTLIFTVFESQMEFPADPADPPDPLEMVHGWPVGPQGTRAGGQDYVS